MALGTDLAEFRGVEVPIVIVGSPFAEILKTVILSLLITAVLLLIVKGCL